MTLKTYGTSNIGGRKTNDDTALILRQGDNAWVFVGDGLGAYAGGKQASQAAGDALMAMSRRGSMLSRERMEEGAQAADAAVKAVQQQTGGSMKTTLVFLAVEGHQARWMHVGDSRLYHFRGGRLIKQTMDHSVPRPRSASTRTATGCFAPWAGTAPSRTSPSRWSCGRGTAFCCVPTGSGSM